MRALTKTLQPLRQAVVAFFSHDLALQRSRQGMKIVLQPRSVERRDKGGTHEQAQAKAREELKLMLAELDALLDQQPGSRQTLRHIVYVHRALRKNGMHALQKLPLDVLQRALEQFESVVSNWSPVGLATLRSKMAVAVIEREHVNQVEDADDFRTSGLLDNLPAIPTLPEVAVHTDDAELAAAYAALAGVAPAGAVEFQAELGSKSAKAVAPPKARVGDALPDLEFRPIEVEA